MSVDSKAYGWLMAAACAGALLAVVFLAWLPERARSADSDARFEVIAPRATDADSLGDAISKFDVRLARIETALAMQDSRGTREQVNPGPTTDGQTELLPTAQEGLSELHRDLLQMSKRIDLLAASLKETYKPAFSLPTLEQIHAARRDVDWTFLNQVRQLCATDRDAARARVRLMTFDDMLRKVGLPTAIEEDGGWIYYRTQMGDNGQPTQVGLGVRFVGDTVSSVSSIP